MAHELSSQEEWQRLYDRYHVMSDGELLRLASGIGGLTKIAGEVLRRQLGERRLEIPPLEVEGGGPAAAGAVHDSESPTSADLEVGRGDVVLTIFYDAIDAGRGCDFLDELEIEFDLQDVSPPRGGLGILEMGPAVSLRLVVRKQDRERAMAVLRAKMGLFPLQEVEVADEAVDDGAVTGLGYFEQREEAEETARILEEAGFWCRVVKNEEEGEEEMPYRLEVREVDVFAAGEALDKAMESAGE